MSIVREEIIQSVTRILKGEKKIVFAYVFGSFLTGHQNDLSDVDIAVFIKDDLSLFEQGSLVVTGHMIPQIEGQGIPHPES